MAAYSMDLRLRVLRDADAGLPSDELAEKYSVSRAWVDRLKQRRRETGEVAPRKQTRWRPRILHAQLTELAALIRERPDRTLAELQEALRFTTSRRGVGSSTRPSSWMSSRRAQPARQHKRGPPYLTRTRSSLQVATAKAAAPTSTRYTMWPRIPPSTAPVVSCRSIATA